MTKYEKKAKDFLKKCNASMNFLYLGCNQNDLWEEPFARDNYIVNIVTPKGNMQVKFWDSKNNTDKNLQRKRCGYSRIYPSPLFPPTNSGMIQSPFITLNLLDESSTSDCAFPELLLSAVK